MDKSQEDSDGFGGGDAGGANANKKGDSSKKAQQQKSMQNKLLISSNLQKKMLQLYIDLLRGCPTTPEQSDLMTKFINNLSFIRAEQQ